MEVIQTHLYFHSQVQLSNLQRVHQQVNAEKEQFKSELATATTTIAAKQVQIEAIELKLRNIENTPQVPSLPVLASLSEILDEAVRVGVLSSLLASRTSNPTIAQQIQIPYTLPSNKTVDAPSPRGTRRPLADQIITSEANGQDNNQVDSEASNQIEATSEIDSHINSHSDTPLSNPLLADSLNNSSGSPLLLDSSMQQMQPSCRNEPSEHIVTSEHLNVDVSEDLLCGPSEELGEEGAIEE